MTYALTALLFLTIGYVIGYTTKPDDNPFTEARKDNSDD